MKYLSVTVLTSPECADLVAYLLMDEGSEGVKIADDNDIKEVLSGGNWDYADEDLLAVKGNQEAKITAVFDLDFSIEGLKRRLDNLKKESPFEAGSLEIESKIIDSADYEDEWKKYFQPIEIGRICLVPAWLDGETKTDKIKILLNPGKAFGTGTHETTSMCLRLLESLEKGKIEGKTVLDVGCGSGILGVTALMLGAKYCVMSDIDIQAVEAAAENAGLNDLMKSCKIIHGAYKGGYAGDLVLANLTADILISLKDELLGSLTKGGMLILSGIIEGRQNEVLEAFRSLRLVSQEKAGEWYALLYAAE